jgi:hypothetical protein
MLLLLLLREWRTRFALIPVAVVHTRCPAQGMSPSTQLPENENDARACRSGVHGLACTRGAVHTTQ